MVQSVLAPRPQKVVRARKSENFRSSASSGLSRIVHLFRSNKENVAADPPSTVYVIPHVQPGAELYPSVVDFAEFIFGLHRSSDRYPSPDPSSPFMRSHTTMPSYDGSIAPEIDHWRAVRMSQESSRGGAARATYDLQKFVKKNEAPGGEDYSETEAGSSGSCVPATTEPSVVDGAPRVQEDLLVEPEAIYTPSLPPPSPSSEVQDEGNSETGSGYTLSYFSATPEKCAVDDVSYVQDDLVIKINEESTSLPTPPTPLSPSSGDPEEGEEGDSETGAGDCFPASIRHL